MFTATFQGLGSFEFDVTSTQIENGRANFTLPLHISLMDICTTRGVISGGNDAGNSKTADIQLPSGNKKEILSLVILSPYPLFRMGYVHIPLFFFTAECRPAPSSSTSTSTVTGIPSSTPLHTTAPPTISSPSSSGAPITIIAGISLSSDNTRLQCGYKITCFSFPQS